MEYFWGFSISDNNVNKFLHLINNKGSISLQLFCSFLVFCWTNGFMNMDCIYAPEFVNSDLRHMFRCLCDICVSRAQTMLKLLLMVFLVKV